MTREEIQKAATDFAEREYEISDIDKDALHKGFYHGALCADEHPAKKHSIWHDTKEKPITGSEIVVICPYKGKKKLLHTVAEPYMIPLLTEKWAYLDDLINL